MVFGPDELRYRDFGSASIFGIRYSVFGHDKLRYRDLPSVSSLRSVGFAELAGVYPAKRGLGSPSAQCSGKSPVSSLQSPVGPESSIRGSSKKLLLFRDSHQSPLTPHSSLFIVRTLLSALRSTLFALRSTLFASFLPHNWFKGLLS